MADKFTFGSAGEIQDLEFALARNGWTHALLKKATGGDFFGLVREVLEGRADICRIERLSGAGQHDTKQSILLEPLGTFAVHAVKKFSAQKSFVVDTSDDAPVKISYIGENFTKWFMNKTETNVPAETLRYANLLRASLDDSIRNEIGKAHEETKLAYVFALMLIQPNGEDGVLLTNGRANIFYVLDTTAALRAVAVDWLGSGWFMYAGSVSGPDGWDDGRRVFSRNSSNAVAV